MVTKWMHYFLFNLFGKGFVSSLKTTASLSRVISRQTASKRRQPSLLWQQPYIRDAAGLNQRNAPTRSRGLWEMAGHTPDLTPTPSGLSVFPQLEVLWFWTKYYCNSVNVEAGRSCTWRQHVYNKSPRQTHKVFLRHLFCYCTSTHQHAPMSRLHAHGCVCTEPTDRTLHPLLLFVSHSKEKVLPQNSTSSRDSFGGVGTQRHKPDCWLVISHSNTHQIISLHCPACPANGVRKYW